MKKVSPSRAHSRSIAAAVTTSGLSIEVAMVQPQRYRGEYDEGRELLWKYTSNEGKHKVWVGGAGEYNDILTDG